MSTWRLIKSPPSDAYTNMAVDEAILEAVSGGSSPPTLRFYTWAPLAVSIGYFQDSLSDIDLDACQKMGIDVVRRLTGGRAVLHDKELTYSVICPEGDPLFPDNILGTYKVISSCLIEGLKLMGLDVSLTPLIKEKRGSKSFDTRHSSLVTSSSSACFISPSYYEITVSGNKLVGSAQRRGEGGFIQHGSILIEFDRERLGMVLPGSAARLEGITSVSEHLSIDTAGLISSLTNGFEEVLGITFSEGFLSDEETALSGKYRERYSSPEWNLGRCAARCVPTLPSVKDNLSPGA